MPIAIDAMGGDFAPRVPILGAIKAVNENGLHVILVGDEKKIQQELSSCKFNHKKVDIVHAEQIVEMDESIVQALKNKKQSSMRIAYNLHKQKDVSGVVSAGHSGAMLAIGKFVLKTIHGIDRPCISALLPSIKGKVLLLDSGANMDCSPYHLLQFAILGDVYTQHILSVPNPKIGLLNIGTESGKGNELAKQTYSLLKKSTSLNFQGNIEGKEFFLGNFDVVLTDGFPGNIFLKSVQGAANFVSDILKEEIKKSWLAKIGALFMIPAIKNLKKKIDYSEYGGAPLLGLRGVGVVCHGNSNPAAIQFGLNFANWAAKANIVPRVEEKISSNQELLDSLKCE